MDMDIRQKTKHGYGHYNVGNRVINHACTWTSKLNIDTKTLTSIISPS